jgi:hypothetical protein
MAIPTPYRLAISITVGYLPKASMSVRETISRQIPRLEQLATKRVLLGTNLGHSALIHTSPSRSSNVSLWRRSARGACLFLLAVLECLQDSAQQKPASPLDEFERRFAAANLAKEAGDLPATAAASEKIVALGLREMG